MEGFLLYQEGLIARITIGIETLRREVQALRNSRHVLLALGELGSRKGVPRTANSSQYPASPEREWKSFMSATQSAFSSPSVLP